MQHTITLDDNDLAAAKMLAHASDCGNGLLRHTLMNGNPDLTDKIGALMKRIVAAEPVVDSEPAMVSMMFLFDQTEPEMETFLIGDFEADMESIATTITSSVSGLMETYSISEIDATLLTAGFRSFEQLGLDPTRFDPTAYGLKFIKDVAES